MTTQTATPAAPMDPFSWLVCEAKKCNLKEREKYQGRTRYDLISSKTHTGVKHERVLVGNISVRNDRKDKEIEQCDQYYNDLRWIY